MDPKKDHISVSIRIRPLLNDGPTNSSCLQIINQEPPVLLLTERSQTYQFDNVFPEDADQDKVYNDAVKPLVDFVMKGYNCTVFAYGQTGTGKTYTMGSGSQPHGHCHTGIIPRALDQLFNEAYINSGEEIDVQISFLEIYNEKIFDLLQADRKSPLPVSGFVVQGLSRKIVRNIIVARQLLELGNKNRHIGETRQNANSSRSHAVFTVYVSLKTSSQEIVGKLNLVDLAGSESVKKTGSKGGTFQEGVNINKGLLCIGQVISALSLKSSHIPYRQSMITSILQGSLNTESYISLIACVSADPEDITETLQTLDFAQRTKRIRCNPEVIAKYKKDNPDLFGHVKTPLKRSITPLKTPAAKRLGVPLLPIINESAHTQISNTDGSVSINLSSVSTVTEVTAQMLSPIIKKIMAKAEARIMERLSNLEAVIDSTSRRPTRHSLRLRKSGSFDKENTPDIAWNKIQDTVSKMVRHEFAQMTGKSARAASSPIDNLNAFPSKRLFNDDILDSSAIELAQPFQDVTQKEFSFKLPLQSPPRVKSKRNSNVSTNFAPRRSVRLSLKHLPEKSFDSNNANKSNWLVDSSKESKSSKEVGINFSIQENAINEERMKYTPFCNNCNGHKTRTSVLRKSSNNQTAKYSTKSPKTPRNVVAKRALVKHKSKESPYSSHLNTVLKILNQGNQKQLVDKLHSIGAKTAEQILLFRELQGGFHKIDDLLKMPGWGAKKYEQFVRLNFLRKI